MRTKENQETMYVQPKGFISVGEAERKFFISRPHIYYLVKNGKIKSVTTDSGLLVKRLHVKKVAELIKTKKENAASRKRDLQRNSLKKRVMISHETKDDDYIEEFINFLSEYIKKDEGKIFCKGLFRTFNNYWKDYLSTQFMDESKSESDFSEYTN